MNYVKVNQKLDVKVTDETSEMTYIAKLNSTNVPCLDAKFYYFYRLLLSSCVCQLLIKFMMMMMLS